MRIGLTGANGFVGSSLSDEIIKRGLSLKRFVRNSSTDEENIIKILDLNSEDSWKDKLKDIDCLIHCAGLAHDLSKKTQNKLNAYNKINVEGPATILKQAIEQRVKRFIFISTSKVHGEFNKNMPFKISDKPNPEGAYSESKLEAENSLRKIALNHNIELVIIRPSLVYGPGVKANFKKLIKFSISGLPIPFKDINNKRSFIYNENLNDMIINCVNNPKAANQTFLVSDDNDVSVSELILKIAKIADTKVILFKLPRHLLVFLLKIIGKASIENSLLSDFRVDISHTKNVLSWSPRYTLDEGLEKTTRFFLKTEI